jgi:hypothetical protein
MVYDDFIYKFQFQSEVNNKTRELHVNARVSYELEDNEPCYAIESTRISLDEKFTTDLYEMLGWVNIELKKDIEKDLDRRIECHIDSAMNEIMEQLKGVRHE